MIDQRLVQRELSRKGDVRFGTMNVDKYKKFIAKAANEYARSIEYLAGDDNFEDYEVPETIQRKVRAQVSKVVNELKKLPDVIR